VTAGGPCQPPASKAPSLRSLPRGGGGESAHGRAALRAIPQSLLSLSVVQTSICVAATSLFFIAFPLT